MKRNKSISLVVLLIFIVTNILNCYSVQAYTTNQNMAKIWVENDIVTNEGDKQYLEIKGWSINESGVKEVKVYIDDKFVGNLTSGQKRMDVKKAYPSYYDSENAGFGGKIDITRNVAPGKRKVKVESIGNDGTRTTNTKSIDITKSAPKAWIEKITETKEGNKQYLELKGWSINASGVKEIKVYVDDKYIGTLQNGQKRMDVKKAYPSYYDSENAGFGGKIDITRNVAPGKRKVKVESIGNDGTRTTNIKSIDITKSAPKAWIEKITETKEGNKQYLELKGWSINASGVKEIKVYVDDKYIGTLQNGQKRMDVKKAYPSYYDSENAGFGGKIDITRNVAPGKRKVKVESIGNDGTRTTNTKSIDITKPAPKIWVEKITEIKKGNKQKLEIKGWSINASGVREVKVYISDKYIGKLTSGQRRDDIKHTYPSYYNSEYAGFSGIIDIPNNIGAGNKILKIISEGNDGSQIATNKTITVGSRLIVIDPGHLGHDSGACAYGVRESDLNAGVAVKLEKQLQGMGYRTYMTRSPLRPNEYAALSTANELKQRYTAANNLKADLFISLHHDVAGSNSSGMWTFYSSWKPGIKNNPSDLRSLTTGYDGNRDIHPTREAQLSKEFGQKVLNNLTSKCGYPAVRPYVVDRNLSVTVHTNMPSVLIELGMMSNRSELRRCQSSSGQQQKAKVIADTVKSMF
ncbi:N-acetylmuramoyl-L-alanine amidase family protein [Inconstantimicrobium porci]|uniref:MurNAc-LAA domain-containing protein n=1 Tax=Inconstantimicrobium porci TaxID=2652291 RepID=A0A7X2MY42_9CLOT|nr:N-acetylmuramoyl-L-alanine amidase [Inconstantimicrobium porci]MSR91212.1 hypothetical protein [Inconstantimicrobium porci]